MENLGNKVGEKRMEKVNVFLFNFVKFFYVSVKIFIFISKLKWLGILLCILIELFLKYGEVVFFFSSK